MKEVKPIEEVTTKEEFECVIEYVARSYFENTCLSMKEKIPIVQTMVEQLKYNYYSIAGSIPRWMLAYSVNDLLCLCEAWVKEKNL